MEAGCRGGIGKTGKDCRKYSTESGTAAVALPSQRETGLLRTDARDASECFPHLLAWSLVGCRNAWSFHYTSSSGFISCLRTL